MKSQSDIALENQKGIEKANERQKNGSEATENDKATQFDGNPNPQSAGDDVLKPEDDTPLFIKKQEKE